MLCDGPAVSRCTCATEVNQHSLNSGRGALNSSLFTGRGATESDEPQLLDSRRVVATRYEGPYGSPSVNFESREYCAIIFVGGGIGCTPLLSIANAIIHDGRDLERLEFVGSFRDVATLKVQN